MHGDDTDVIVSVRFGGKQRHDRMGANCLELMPWVCEQSGRTLLAGEHCSIAQGNLVVHIILL